MKRILELEKLGDIYREVKTSQVGTTNFISWERLDRECLAQNYPREYITGITVSDRGLEIRLEPKPKGQQHEG